MLKKLLYIFTFFTFFAQISSQPTCSNYNHKQLKKLKNTDWIPVQWDTGSCYFHNTKTKQDQDKIPNLDN